MALKGRFVWLRRRVLKALRRRMQLDVRRETRGDGTFIRSCLLMRHRCVGYEQGLRDGLAVLASSRATWFRLRERWPLPPAQADVADPALEMSARLDESRQEREAVEAELLAEDPDEVEEAILTHAAALLYQLDDAYLDGVAEVLGLLRGNVEPEQIPRILDELAAVAGQPKAKEQGGGDEI